MPGCQWGKTAESEKSSYVLTTATAGLVEEEMILISTDGLIQLNS